MIEEIAVKKHEVKADQLNPRKEGGKLKQRAFLNALTSLIDYAGAQLTGFVVSPFLVSGLGSSLYGVWQMLGQMTGYSNLADARATQALKWTVAKKQDIVSEEELRSDVSSAFFVTAFVVPLVLIAGGIISWYAPFITKADPSYYTLIRVSSSTLVLSLAISKVFDLYEAVLRGMNLGYKRMGLRAAIVVGGGILKILVIEQGFGLIGLSVVQLVISLVTGLTFYFIVKRSIGWFGFGKTNMKKVLQFSKLSGWYMANTATDTLLNNTDKVMLGFIAGPVLVSKYALTLFLPLAVQGLILRIISGAIPGIGKLFGLHEYSKISKIWVIMNYLIFLLSTSAGVTILLFNQSFLHVWVGEGHFAGTMANLIIIVMVIQDTLIKHDGFIISATLDLKKKVYLTLSSVMVFAIPGILLVKNFGIEGLCLSLICGKFLLFIGQRLILKRKLQHDLSPTSFSKIQSLAISLIMLGSAFYISTFIEPLSLISMMGLVPVTFILSFFIFYALGLRKEQRTEILGVISSIRFFKSK
jgi:O-antigen/teichoic acid export membrane protein